MTNEYLFLSDEHRAAITEYRQDDVTISFSGVGKTSLWIAACSVTKKKEDNAGKLSDVHTTLLQYSPLVLTCESSEYYNKMLFPLINELERKLRKLLYIAASISDDGNAKESINQLEEKDFGEIFDLLFIDLDFINRMKKRINADSKSEFNGKGKYSKNEIRLYLDSLPEHTLWDIILDKEDVSTLRSRFRDVQTYRNDVMHAHNIDKKQYGKAHYLFDKVNKELGNAIDRLTGTTEDKLASKKPEVNTAISSALTAMSLSDILDELKSVSVSPGVLEMPSQMSKILEGLQPTGASTAMTEALKTYQTSPAIEKLRELLSSPSEVMRQYQQLLENSKQYSALQASLHSMTSSLQSTLNLTDDLNTKNKVKDLTESETYIDMPEEDHHVE